MTLRDLRVAFACSVLAVGACRDDATAPQTNATQQSSAKALWEATRPVRYTFVAGRSCECLADFAGPVRIEVSGAAIVSVRRVDNDAAVNPALWFDIDGLFDLIDTELVQRPSRLETEYDTRDGHPTYIAYGEREVDGGAVIEVTEFITLIGGTGGYLRR
jgi:hypothetical protein